jgi:hypothetical protein
VSFSGSWCDKNARAGRDKSERAGERSGRTAGNAPVAAIRAGIRRWRFSRFDSRKTAPIRLPASSCRALLRKPCKPIWINSRRRRFLAFPLLAAKHNELGTNRQPDTGASVTEEKTRELHERAGGWMIALTLHLKHYRENGEFAPAADLDGLLAERLSVTVNTVKAHLKAAYRKSGVNSRAGLRKVFKNAPD